jgi:hypothetical protein
MAIGSAIVMIAKAAGEFAPTAIEAYGQFQEGKQRAQAGEFNADIDRQQARIVRAKGKIETFRQRKAKKAFTSTQQALFSKAGVTFSGSPLVAMEESAANAELDILISKFNTFSESQRLETSAKQREIVAESERTSGLIRAGTTLLASKGTQKAGKTLLSAFNEGG